ncbi:MAG: hypothetical protein CVU80_02645, partial [Elusimicrobia bacterium HGW-Elusimicrobia-4]
MLDELTGRMLADWERLFPAIKRPWSIRYLGIPGSIEGGTTTFLGFSQKAETPLFAVKIHRDIDAMQKALGENSILSFLDSRSGELSTSVPQMILCERIAGTWVLVQSILDGRPMVAVMSRDGVPEPKRTAVNMRLATDWLALLHAETWDNTATVEQDRLEMINQFSGIFDLSSEELDYLTRI